MQRQKSSSMTDLSCPTLECIAFKVLINNGGIFSVPKSTDSFQQDSIASVLEQNIPRLIPEFLQAVVDLGEISLSCMREASYAISSVRESSYCPDIIL